MKRVACTAPVKGHTSYAEIDACPVHKKQRGGWSYYARAGGWRVPGLPPSLAALDHAGLHAQAMSSSDPAVLARLATVRGHSDDVLLFADALVANPCTPRNVIRDILAESRPSRCEGFKSNTAFGAAELEVLASDGDPKVRLAAAYHPQISPESLAGLAADHEWGVLVTVAAHRRTPPEVLASLFAGGPHMPEPHAEIQSRALLNRRFPTEALPAYSPKMDGRVCEALAERPDCPPETLRALAGHRKATVRQRVAGNPSTPRDVLVGLLTKDGTGWAVKNAARNPATPLEALEQIVVGSDPDAKRALVKNPKVTLSMLARLRRDPQADNNKTRADIDRALRRAVASATGIAEYNREALDYVLDNADLSTLDPDDPAVMLAHAMFPDG